MKIKDLFKEQSQKSLMDLDILKKKYNIDKKYLIIPLILVIFFFLNKRYFVFGALTVISGIFSFYHDKFNRTPIDFKLPLVLGIFVTRYYGIQFTLIFFILSDVIPSLLGGGHIEGTTLFFYSWFFVINTFVIIFPDVDIITLGIILTFIESIGSVIIKSFFGIPGVVSIVSSALSVLTRIVYFLTLGPVLRIILQNI